MTWRDLSFMHWRVDPDALRPLIPEPLEVDLFGGEAWVGVVPFEMRGTRLWPLPTVPGLRHFPELNLRTYVRHGDRQGVWFFSLDACSKVAVRVARQTFALPYLDARMSIEREPGAVEDGWIRYSSQRRDAFGAPRGVFRGRYRPCGPAAAAAEGSLEHFRRSATPSSPSGASASPGAFAGAGARRHRARPVALQPAEGAGGTRHVWIIGLLPEGPPMVHFARELRVRAFPPRRVGR